MARVLIADSDRLSRELIREALSTNPTFTLLEAKDGLEAVEQARAHQPHLVIADTSTPKLSGFVVCRLIKADFQLRTTPILLTTVSTDPAEPITARRAGANGFLRKPFRKDQLLDLAMFILQAKKVARAYAD